MRERDSCRERTICFGSARAGTTRQRKRKGIIVFSSTLQRASRKVIIAFLGILQRASCEQGYRIFGYLATSVLQTVTTKNVKVGSTKNGDDT